MSVLLRIRNKLAKLLSRWLVPESFSIISDDCWGGQIYRQLRIPYLTPTVGLWIRPRDYIDYLQNLKKIHLSDLNFIESQKPYPVATISDIELNFMHFSSASEALDKYWERYSRIDLENVYYKIDFGKPGYTVFDINRWNELRLPNSVAFYSRSTELPKEGVYNGVKVLDWQLDGAAMFDITRRYFDLFAWLRSGRIELGILYRILNIILYDPTAPRRIANKWMRPTG